MTTLSPSASAASWVSVSCSAAREWITSGLPVSRASAIWAAKARCWSGSGAPRRYRSMPVSPIATQRRCADSARSSARSASSKPLAALGWRPTAAYTWGNASAAASAARQEALSMPIVSISLTPAASAAATSSASGSSHRSRWVCESITAAGSRGLRKQRLDRAHPRDRARAQVGARERGVGSSERREQPLHAGGHVRPQQHGHRAQSLGERAQHAVEILASLRLGRQPPRRLLLDVAVQPPHALPDLIQ